MDDPEGVRRVCMAPNCRLTVSTARDRRGPDRPDGDLEAGKQITAEPKPSVLFFLRRGRGPGGEPRVGVREARLPAGMRPGPSAAAVSEDLGTIRHLRVLSHSRASQEQSRLRFRDVRGGRRAALLSRLARAQRYPSAPLLRATRDLHVLNLRSLEFRAEYRLTTATEPFRSSWPPPAFATPLLREPFPAISYHVRPSCVRWDGRP